MRREIRRLADSRFDLVVVGGGFYGAVAAWDATLRGLSVALIDRGDFGAATSFNNLKTLHGGLRALQSLNLRQMRLFIRERRALARVAPHLVQPLGFVVPTYRSIKRSAALMRVALAINDLVARDRHEGLDDSRLQLPASEILSRDACLRLNPVVNPDGVTGGALWYDYQMPNADRMTFSFVRSAAEAGAAVANYVGVTGFLRTGERVEGVRALETLRGEELDIRASVVLNATGPWAASLLGTLGHAGHATPAPRLSRAMNLVTRAGVGAHGCGGLAGGRFLFLVPWRGGSILGTSHDTHDGPPDALAVTRGDIEALLAEAREAFPRAALTPADVRLVHRGLLPMVSGHGRHVHLLRESAVVDHRDEHTPGLVSMFGVRYTTARATAARAVDAVFGNLDREPPACRTAETPVFGGAIADTAQFVSDVVAAGGALFPPDALRRIALGCGRAADDVLALARELPELAAPLGGECAVTGAEILYAVRRESAVRLSDALIRRTEAGSAGSPGADAVARAAAIMARELQWNAETIEAEIADVEAFYRVPN